MTNAKAGGSGLTIFGKLFSVLLVAGLVGLSAWIILKKNATNAANDVRGTIALHTPAPPPRRTGGSGGESGVRYVRS